MTIDDDSDDDEGHAITDIAAGVDDVDMMLDASPPMSPLNSQDNYVGHYHPVPISPTR
jgi:hypothetical protein